MCRSVCRLISPGSMQEMSLLQCSQRLFLEVGVEEEQDLRMHECTVDEGGRVTLICQQMSRMVHPCDRKIATERWTSP